MLFSIKFINLELKESTFSTIQSKVVEICEDCIVHDCHTEEGFTIQVKSRDFNTKGRIELKANYNDSNILVVEIEKEFQTPWALKKMEILVDELQNFDQGLK